MSGQLLMKLNTDSPHNPAIPLLCMFPPKWKLMLTWKHVQACVLMNTIANNWKQPRCSAKWMATHPGASTWQNTIQWHSTAIKGTNYRYKQQGWIRDTCEKSQSQRLHSYNSILWPSGKGVIVRTDPLFLAVRDEGGESGSSFGEVGLPSPDCEQSH